MTDLRIKPFDFQAAVARAGLRPDGMPAGGADGAAGVQGGFKAAMSSAPVLSTTLTALGASSGTLPDTSFTMPAT